MPTKRALEAGIKVAWEGEGGVSNGLFSLMTPFITRKNRQGVIIAADQAIRPEHCAEDGHRLGLGSIC